MDKEQIKAIAEKADDYADDYLQSKGEFHPNWHDVRDEYFANAAIESYKAELLKEVGEQVGYHYLPDNEMFPVEEVSRSNLKNNPQDYVFLYTSDQVAAAILKAEQRVAEAVWKAMTEGETYEDIFAGEWRKFVKEV